MLSSSTSVPASGQEHHNIPTSRPSAEISPVRRKSGIDLDAMLADANEEMNRRVLIMDKVNGKLKNLINRYYSRRNQVQRYERRPPDQTAGLDRAKQPHYLASPPRQIR